MTIAVVAACLAGTYFAWFRDSGLVAVEEVRVQGLSGPGSGEVAARLEAAALEMTTLHVREEELAAAVADLPTVVGVSADADFPSGLTITVADRPPVMIAAAGGREVPVAGDGTLLEGVEVKGARLPVVGVAKLPGSGALGGEDLELARVAGGAPEPLAGLIGELEPGGAEGVTVTLKGEIPVYFGTGERATEKWAAVAAILARPRVEELTYLDVRVPERPALGGAASAPEAATAGA